jgi:hypothetical protein
MDLPLVLCLCLFPFLQLTVSKGDGPASCPVSVAPLVMDLTLSLNHYLVYSKHWGWAWLFYWIILQFIESNGYRSGSFIESFSSSQIARVMGLTLHWIILQFTESSGDGHDSFKQSFSSLQKAVAMSLTLSLSHSPVYIKEGWWARLFHRIILQFTEYKGDGPDSFIESFFSVQKARVMGLTLSLNPSPAYRKQWWWASSWTNVSNFS